MQPRPPQHHTITVSHNSNTTAAKLSGVKVECRGYTAGILSLAFTWILHFGILSVSFPTTVLPDYCCVHEQNILVISRTASICLYSSSPEYKDTHCTSENRAQPQRLLRGSPKYHRKLLTFQYCPKRSTLVERLTEIATEHSQSNLPTHWLLGCH